MIDMDQVKVEKDKKPRPKLKLPKKKSILIFFLVIIVLGSAAFGAYIIYDKRNRSPIEGLSDAQIRAKLEEIQKKEYQKLTDKVDLIKSLDDLKKLDENDQISVGDLLMKRLYENKDYENLLIYAEYLSYKGGSIAIDALKYCYNVEIDQSKKSNCLKRLNEEAKKQGIIAENESLPSTYLEMDEPK